jgi:trans-aconitate methyltransferase
MSLLDHYRNQRAWRAFDLALDALPSLDGARILDLGCGVGDQVALLVAREVIERVWDLRKVLNELDPIEAMEMLIAKMSKPRVNGEFLMTIG